MANYLKKGGAVEDIPRGISGKDPGEPLTFLNRSLFAEPRASRTLVPEVVAAIEERRQAKLKRKPAPKASKLQKEKQKTIYDDFGEPLRKVWVKD